MKRLVWFRNDLRLHDNETVAAALTGRDANVSFLYVYDEKHDGPGAQGYSKIGQFRRKFLAESVSCLRRRLQSMGSDLICAVGDPKEIVPDICRQLLIDQVFHSRLTAFNENRDEIEIGQRLKKSGVTCLSFQTHTLLVDQANSTFDLYQLMSFSKFKKHVEKSWPIREPVLTIEGFGAHHCKPQTVDVPLWQFDRYLTGKSHAKGIAISGGELAALEHLREYMWDGDHLRSYKETRNGLIKMRGSSKFSPALASGCLSVRTLYQEVRRYERERTTNSSTLWFLYELLWRDHFHFAAAHRGSRLFTDVPLIAKASTATNNQLQVFEKWRRAQTTSAFINAAMNELALTGWLSNRMRQNAASFLIHDLGIDWNLGAKWFETCLIDYDPCSNWGNWAYIAGAGVGNQPHAFNVEQQSRAYDPDGEYVKLWAAETTAH